jgi:hypothetical protein
VARSREPRETQSPENPAVALTSQRRRYPAFRSGLAGALSLSQAFPSSSTSAQPRWPETIFQRPGAIFTAMGIRPSHVRKPGLRDMKVREDLLDVWLNLLNQLDNPVRRRGSQVATNPTTAPRYPDPTSSLAFGRGLISDLERFERSGYGSGEENAPRLGVCYAGCPVARPRSSVPPGENAELGQPRCIFRLNHK